MIYHCFATFFDHQIIGHQLSFLKHIAFYAQCFRSDFPPMQATATIFLLRCGFLLDHIYRTIKDQKQFPLQKMLNHISLIFLRDFYLLHVYLTLVSIIYFFQASGSVLLFFFFLVSGSNFLCFSH